MNAEQKIVYKMLGKDLGMSFMAYAGNLEVPFNHIKTGIDTKLVLGINSLIARRDYPERLEEILEEGLYPALNKLNGAKMINDVNTYAIVNANVNRFNLKNKKEYKLLTSTEKPFIDSVNDLSEENKNEIMNAMRLPVNSYATDPNILNAIQLDVEIGRGMTDAKKRKAMNEFYTRELVNMHKYATQNI